MANIDPAPSWANIRRLETTDRNMAGPGGILNDPTTSIAARLNLLRDNDATLGNSIADVNSRQDAADAAIANIQGQVLNAPGTLSDLENGSALDPAAGFPDVPSVENALGPVTAINGSIDALTARTKQLRKDSEDITMAVALKLRQVANVADLRMITGTDNEVVYLNGYTAPGPGAGLMRWVAGSSLADDGGMIFAGPASLGRWARILPDPVVKLSYYGVTTDSDASVALAAAINWSKLNGFNPVQVDVSRVILTAAMPQLNSSFDCVPIVGKSSDSRRTVIDVTAAPDGVFSVRGGSGVIGGVFMRDFTLRAEGRTPIYCTGFCGFTVQNVRIYAGTAAWLSTDISAGTFTEFFIFNNCQIWCDRLFRVTRGAGDGSFHGCGFNNGTVINKTTDSATALIELNEGDTGRAVWYNCQVDGTVFWRGTNNYIISLKNPSVTGSIINVSGFLRVERFSDGVAVLVGDSDRVFFAGQIQSLAGDTGLGSARRVEIVDYGSSGAPTGMLAPTFRKNIKAAGVSSLVLDNVRDDYYGTFVSLSITGSNYHYTYILHILGTFNTLAGVVTTIATPRAFNAAGIGTTTFSMTGSRLTVSGDSNWTAAALTVSASIMPSVMSQAATG